MNIGFSLEEVEIFMLVFFRVAAILFTAPIFSGRSMPTLLKTGIALWVSIAFVPGIGLTEFQPIHGPFTMALAIMQEMLVGITVGFIAQIIVVVAVMGGHIVGKHMGLAIANVLDPLSGTNTSITGGIMNVGVILVLLSFDYHIILINTLYSSYQIIPPLGVQVDVALVPLLVSVGGNVFVFSLQLVAPLFAALFFLEVMLALMAKLGRQFNILMLQFPIKIFVGLLLFPLFLVNLPEAVRQLIDWALRNIHEAFKLMAG